MLLAEELCLSCDPSGAFNKRFGINGNSVVGCERTKLEGNSLPQELWQVAK